MTASRSLVVALLASAALIACERQTPAASSSGAPVAATPAVSAPTSGEGFSRRAFGQAEVTTVADGGIQGEFSLFAGLDEAEARRLLEAAGEPGPPQLDVHGFVVNVGGRRVLVDTGAGTSMGPTTGRFAANLAAAGVVPESVEHVVISHMHGDHIGGLLDGEGRPRFPNALVHIDAAEIGYWTDEGRAAAAPEMLRAFHAAAQAVTAAYGRRVRPFDSETEIVPGFTAIPAHGHTPGHALYRLRSGDQEMLFFGDMIHSTAIQFPRPDVSVSFDDDQDAARATRIATLRGMGATTLAAGPHFPYPGVGRVERVGEGYRWVPVAATPAAR